MFISNAVNKKGIENVLNNIFINSNERISSTFDKIKDLGFYYSTLSGISISVDDLAEISEKKELLFNCQNNVENILKYWQKGIFSTDKKSDSLITTWEELNLVLFNTTSYYYNTLSESNSLSLIINSGSRGNLSQVQQLINTRGLLVDSSGNLIESPIIESLKEGLAIKDFLFTSNTARKGSVDTSIKTADSGFLTRQLIFTLQNFVIRSKDCCTNRTISAANFSSSNKHLNSSTFIRTNTYKNPLTCNYFVCQQCFGKNTSRKRLVSLGAPIGVIAAHSIGEPGTQMTLKTFHAAGAFSGAGLGSSEFLTSGLLKATFKINSFKFLNNLSSLYLCLINKISITLHSWTGLKKSHYFFNNVKFNTDSYGFISKIKNRISFHSPLFSKKNKDFNVIYSKDVGKISFNSIVYEELNLLDNIKFVRKEGNIKIKTLSNNNIVEYIGINNFIQFNSFKKVYHFNELVYNNFNQNSSYKLKREEQILIERNKKELLFLNNNQYFDYYTIYCNTQLHNKNQDNLVTLYNKFDNKILTDKMIFLLGKTTLNENSFSNKINANHIPENNNIISINRHALLKCSSDKMIKSNECLGYTIFSAVKGGDIIQVVPKIHDLLEASNSSFFNIKKENNLPKLILNNYYIKYIISNKFLRNLFSFSPVYNFINKKIKKFFNFSSNLNIFNFPNYNNAYFYRNIKLSVNDVMKKDINGKFFNISSLKPFKPINLNQLMTNILEFQEHKDGRNLGIQKAMNKSQLVLTNSFLGLYGIQDVFLVPKYFELLSKRLISRLVIEGFPFLNNSSETLFVNANNSILFKKAFIKLNLNEKMNKSLNIFSNKKSFYTLKEETKFLYFLKKYQNWIRNKIDTNFKKSNIKDVYPVFFQQGEEIDFTKLNLLSQIFYKTSNLKLKAIPEHLGISEFLGAKDNFLESSSYEANIECLADHALYGSIDWTYELRSSGMFSNKSLSGPIFLQNKENFNNLYYYKK